MAKRPTKTEKLRSQLAELQRQLEQAEQAEQEERLKRIEQAARRSGILAMDAPVDEIENFLRDLANRVQSAPEPEPEGKAVPDTSEPAS